MILSEEHKKRLKKLAGLEETPRTVSLTSKKSAKYRNPKGPAKYFAPYNNLEEIEKDEIKIPEKYIKDNLNEKIWKNNSLNPKVRKKLIQIAKEFYKFLKINAPLKDVTFTGSMANYNWTKHSDIDLHLMIDYEDVGSSETEIVPEYLTAKKSIWNEKHNIKIYGYDVELYAQDVNEPHHSTGVYSIIQDKWLTKPKKKDFKVDKKSIKEKVFNIAKEIERIESIESPERKYIQGNNLKDKIKKMRKAGLEDSGEFSVENLAFKHLRNEGYLKKLFDIVTFAYDKTLSIEENEVLAEELVERVKKIHRNPKDFENGFLDKLITKYPLYVPTGIMFTGMDLNEWDTDEKRVNKFVEMYKKNPNYPPIIYDPENNSIIDGMHRVKALEKLGLKEVRAYVGKRK